MFMSSTGTDSRSARAHSFTCNPDQMARVSGHGIGRVRDVFQVQSAFRQHWRV